MEYAQKFIKYKDKIVFEKRSVPNFRRLPKEYFETEACFIFVNEGEISVRSQTNITKYDKQTALLAKCLNYFFELNKEQITKNKGVEVIGVVLYPSLIQDIFGFDINTSNFRVNYNLKQVKVDSMLKLYKESINFLLDNPEMADEEMIKNKLREFVLLITKSEGISSQLDFLAAIFNPEFAEFKQIINKNTYSSLSIDELARLCHMSTSSFKRKFSEIYNDSPAKYLGRMKIEKAKSLLLKTDLRISDIAYDCGFESISTFNRSFKAFYQISPSDFRLN